MKREGDKHELTLTKWVRVYQRQRGIRVEHDGYEVEVEFDLDEAHKLRDALNTLFPPEPCQRCEGKGSWPTTTLSGTGEATEGRENCPDCPGGAS